MDNARIFFTLYNMILIGDQEPNFLAQYSVVNTFSSEMNVLIYDFFINILVL